MKEKALNDFRAFFINKMNSGQDLKNSPLLH